MRILVTGGSGVLGRTLIPLLSTDGHKVVAPRSTELDLFSPEAIGPAMTGIEAVYHLATRIPSQELGGEPGAWEKNDRLRREATRVLVDVALLSNVETFVLPSITFMYPANGPADEDTVPSNIGGRLQSMLDAEAAVGHFAAGGKRGIVLRLGLLWGPGTGNDVPVMRYNSTLHIQDAAEALRLALEAPGGTYNVVSDGERIANARFKAATGWQPRF